MVAKEHLLSFRDVAVNASCTRLMYEGMTHKPYIHVRARACLLTWCPSEGDVIGMSTRCTMKMHGEDAAVISALVSGLIVNVAAQEWK